MIHFYENLPLCNICFEVVLSLQSILLTISKSDERCRHYLQRSQNPTARDKLIAIPSLFACHQAITVTKHFYHLCIQWDCFQEWYINFQMAACIVIVAGYANS